MKGELGGSARKDSTGDLLFGMYLHGTRDVHAVPEILPQRMMLPPQGRQAFQDEPYRQPTDVLLLRLSPSVDEAMLLRLCTAHCPALSVSLLPSASAQQAVLTYASPRDAAEAVAHFNRFVSSAVLRQSPAFVTGKSHCSIWRIYSAMELTLLGQQYEICG